MSLFNIYIYIFFNTKYKIYINWKSGQNIYYLSKPFKNQIYYMNIRNFCIIAHIDHGKSTLADRMLEITGTVRKVDRGQMLDKLELEQERWITIKLTPARMKRKWYEFNLIDTPGHVDFQYEVSRSLAACQWVVLLVDASQWVQAQTLSTLYMAMDYGLEIIPVLNKIDLPAADPERVGKEIEKLLWIPSDQIIKISGKTWENVNLVLDEIINKVPNPIPDIWDQITQKSDRNWYQPLTDELQNIYPGLSRCLIFDCVYDPYKWVVAYVQVLDWSFKAGQVVKTIYGDSKITITEVWHFDPNYVVDKSLDQWQIWYIVTGQKWVRDVLIGDTIYISSHDKNLTNQQIKNDIAVKWFKKVTPYVYAWVYPISNNEFDKLRDSFEKLILNDSAVQYEYENNKALGFGFRCGFLWMLHMDIVKERLVREFGVETIFTIPNVIYAVLVKNGQHEKIKSWQNVLEIITTWMRKHIFEYDEKLMDIYISNNLTDDIMNKIHYSLEYEHVYREISEILKYWIVVRSGVDMPPNGMIETVLEPIANVEVVWPNEYYGQISWLCQEYRWELKSTEFIDETRVLRKYTMPLWEIIIDFYDKLKGMTKWYATMNYDFRGYNSDNLTKLDILINWEIADSFSMIVHESKAYNTWSEIVTKLKELIPKHLFAIPLQAAVGSRVIARENISAIRKDVLAKCYWWDISRKRKLLENQKEGKKKMKEMWKVSMPNDIFIKMVMR